jgi:hypothetical protein
LRVTKQINALHLAPCPASYKLLLNATLRSWRNDKNLVHFCNYFERQWVGYTNSRGEWRESQFNKWQIFWTPPGFSATNSPLEGYNGVVKIHFTMRLKFHMRPAIEVFKGVIIAESRATRTISNSAKVSSEQKKWTRLNLTN